MSEGEIPARQGVEFIGPFVAEWKVTVDGYQVPYLTAIPQSDSDEISLSLDERYLLFAPREECVRWLPFLFEAMAIAAGFSCYGEHGNRMENRFRNRLIGVGTFDNETEVTPVPDEDWRLPPAGEKA